MFRGVSPPLPIFPSLYLPMPLCLAFILSLFLVSLYFLAFRFWGFFLPPEVQLPFLHFHLKSFSLLAPPYLNPLLNCTRFFAAIHLLALPYLFTSSFLFLNFPFLPFFILSSLSPLALHVSCALDPLLLVLIRKIMTLHLGIIFLSLGIFKYLKCFERKKKL